MIKSGSQAPGKIVRQFWSLEQPTLTNDPVLTATDAQTLRANPRFSRTG
jgi:hypothetical protein